MSGDTAPDINILTVVQQIKQGSLDPKSMSKDVRRMAVEVLNNNGLDIHEIARLLRISDRTIQRDLKEYRESLRLEPHPDLVYQIAGRLVREMDMALAHLRRLARDKATPAHVKVEAEVGAFQIFCKGFEKLQSIGYLPNHTGSISAGAATGGRLDVARIVMDLQQLKTTSDSWLGPDDPDRRDIDMLSTAANALQGGNGDAAQQQ